LKKKAIKIFKIFLPILIGIYLTWYFVSNATSVEKRSFYISTESSATEYIELSTQNNKKFSDESFIEILLKNNFKFHKSLSFDKIENIYTTTVTKSIFELSNETPLNYIEYDNNYYVFFLSGIEPEVTRQDFINSFKSINYWWVIFALIIAFLSHISRSFRWKYLLEPINIKPSLGLMYHSVMIGYIINLTIPRSGEVARAAYFSKYYNCSSEKVFGTIVVERVIDLVMFGLIFFTTLLLQSDQDKFNQLRSIESTQMPTWVIFLIILIASALVFLVIYVPKIKNKLVKFIKGILEGCMTILKLKHKTAFITHTIFIWSAYVLMLWLTSLSIPSLELLKIDSIFACFVAGTIAIGATPGGIGLYPIMVASVLIKLYGYPPEVANSFGILMWSSQTMLMVLLGLVSLIAIKRQL
tara:strand:- start:4080 stop:5318 length:1239 start_codon:yes stop_codon:yes gene_type:complete